MPFVKGQSGNPGGRPKRSWTWSGLYEEELKKVLPTVEGKSVIARVAVAKRLIKMAIEGDIQAIKELTNRMDGMPQVDVTSKGEKLEFPTIYKPTKKEI